LKGQELKMAYVLEAAIFQVVPMPYSYMRRAQATLHRTVWKQVAVADEIRTLEEFAASLAQEGVEYRITGVGPHCLFEGQELKR
jgi:hypothetical protein